MPPQDPIQLAMQRKDRIKAMPPEIQLRLADALFRRFMVPKLRRADPKINVDDLSQLRVKFAGTLLDIPGGAPGYERHDEPPPEKHYVKEGLKGLSTLVTSPVATAEGAAAGALGDLKSLSDAVRFFDRTDPKNDKIQQAIEGTGNRLYADAQKRDPLAADIGASLGKQGPAMAVAGEVGKAMGPAKGVISGAAKGGAEMLAYSGTSGDKLSNEGLGIGMALGAFFPVLGKIFGLKGGAAADKSGSLRRSLPEETGAVAKGDKPVAAPVSPKGSQSLADIVAQKKFGKNLRDLSPQEKVQLPGHMQEELKTIAAARRAEKIATRKANKEAAKQVTNVAQKAEAAKAAAAEQVKERKAKATSTIETQAVAAKASEENPQMSKAAAAVTDAVKPEVKPETKPIESVKVPKGQHGTGKIAQQAKDRERIASVRSESVRTQQMESLEQQARSLVGKVSSENLKMVPVPELEEAAKQFDPQGMITKGLEALRKKGKLDDDTYKSALMEFILKNFEETPK